MPNSIEFDRRYDVSHLTDFTFFESSAVSIAHATEMVN